MNAKHKPLVPNFIFPLNNKSSSPNPRKEAFKFREGIIIVSTPILSEADAFECLQKACHAFGVDPPIRFDMYRVLRGMTATESIKNAKEVARVIQRRRRNSEEVRRWDWKSKHRSYFDQRPSSTIKPPVKPMPPMKRSQSEHDNVGTAEIYFDFPGQSCATKPTSSGPMPPAKPLTSKKQNIATTEHVEGIAEEFIDGPVTFVDGRDWQDRLVPSAKMENARRAHVTRFFERSKQAEGSHMENAEDRVGILMKTGPVLLTRDGQRAIDLPEYNPIVGTWSRIQAWRKNVAKEMDRAPRPPVPRGFRRNAGLASSRNVPAMSSTNGAMATPRNVPASSSTVTGSKETADRKWEDIQNRRKARNETAGKRIWDDKSSIPSSKVRKGSEESVGTAARIPQWKPMKILSRNNPTSQIDEVELKSKDLSPEVHKARVIKNTKDNIQRRLPKVWLPTVKQDVHGGPKRLPEMKSRDLEQLAPTEDILLFIGRGKGEYQGRQETVNSTGDLGVMLGNFALGLEAEFKGNGQV